MTRDKWVFKYVASQLTPAAQSKIDWHTERLAWWTSKKEQVLTTIRNEGLDVDEGIASQFSHPKSRDWDRGAQVVVRRDLQKHLEECLEKLQFHTRQLSEYSGWHQILIVHLEKAIELDIEDWLFFFGKESTVIHNL